MIKMCDPYECKRCTDNTIERIYVTNITKDEVMMFNDVIKTHPDYSKNPLHHLVCDKGYKEGHPTEHQVGFIITEQQVNQIKEKGFCDVVCTK